MATAALILFLIGLGAVLFGAWGQHTEAGRARYDEMAGMIPYFAGWVGILLLVIAIILGIVTAVRR